MRIIRFALAAALALLALPASAFAAASGTLTVPTTVNGISDTVTLSVTGATASGKIDIYARVQNASSPNQWVCVSNAATADGSGNVSSTVVVVSSLVKWFGGQTPTPVNGTKIEWALVDDGSTTACTVGTGTSSVTSLVSPTPVSTLAGPTMSITAPGFVNGTSDNVTYSVTTPSFTGTATVNIYARVHSSTSTGNTWICVAQGITAGPNSSSTNNSVTIASLGTTLSSPPYGSTIEWAAVAETSGCTVGTTTVPAPGPVVQDTSVLDSQPPTGFAAAPPQTGADPSKPPVACTSFEIFGVAKDVLPSPVPTLTPVSGIASFSFTTNGMTPLTAGGIGPRAAATPGPTMVAKVSDFTFPSGASGPWTFSAQAKDVAGNVAPSPTPLPFLSVSDASKVGACTTFPDLAGHWAAVYAGYLSTNTANTPALFQGMPTGSGTIFGPDATMTRAMLAKVLVSAVEPGATLPTSAPSGCSFSDVPTGQWYTQWVWEACRLGLMQGVGSGLFDPDGALTRGQAATAIDRLNTAANGGYLSNNSVVKASGVAIRGTPSFIDVPVGQYYTSAVLDLYARDVIDGTSATTFSPDATLTRGQLAKILYRALAQATTF